MNCIYVPAVIKMVTKKGLRFANVEKAAVCKTRVDPPAPKDTSKKLSKEDAEWAAWTSDGKYVAPGLNFTQCFCTNGDAANFKSKPKCTNKQPHMCLKCVDGYFLNTTKHCETNRCSCLNGVKEVGKKCLKNGDHNCKVCNGGFTRTRNVTRHGDTTLTVNETKTTYRCARNICTCRNGIPATTPKYNQIFKKNITCDNHQKNICQACNPPDDPNDPINTAWYLSPTGKYGPECVRRPCNRCEPKCNEKMEQGAWLVKMDLATSGMTLALPKPLQVAVGLILPVHSVTLYSVGYAGLVLASEKGQTLRNIAKKINNVKAAIKSGMKKAGKLMKRMAETRLPNGTTYVDPVQGSIADKMAESGKPPTIIDIIRLFGMNATEAKTLLDRLESNLGGLSIQESLDSISAEANSTGILVTAQLTFRKNFTKTTKAGSGASLLEDGSSPTGASARPPISRFYNITLYAKDYTNPTQKQKESICQPERKVLGLRCQGGLGLDGTRRKLTLFNTLKGDLRFKARYKTKEDYDLRGEFQGSGGIGFGDQRKMLSMGINLKNMTASIERKPNMITIKKFDKHIAQHAGGVSAHILAAGGVKFPLMKEEVVVNAIGIQYAYDKGWAFKFDTTVPFGQAGRIRGSVVGIQRNEWPKGPAGILWHVSLGVVGTQNFKFARLPIIRLIPNAITNFLPEILPGGKMTMVIASKKLKETNTTGWSPFMSGNKTMPGLHNVHYPDFEVLGNLRDMKTLVEVNRLDILPTTCQFNKNAYGFLTGGRDVKVTTTLFYNFDTKAFLGQFMMIGGPRFKAGKLIDISTEKVYLKVSMAGYDPKAKTLAKPVIEFLGHGTINLFGVAKFRVFVAGDSKPGFFGLQAYGNGTLLGNHMELLVSAAKGHTGASAKRAEADEANHAYIKTSAVHDAAEDEYDNLVKMMFVRDLMPYLKAEACVSEGMRQRVTKLGDEAGPTELMGCVEGSYNHAKKILRKNAIKIREMCHLLYKLPPWRRDHGMVHYCWALKIVTRRLEHALKVVMADEFKYLKENLLGNVTGAIAKMNATGEARNVAEAHANKQTKIADLMDFSHPAKYSATLRFTGGLKLSSLPLISKVPGVKYIPPLGNGTLLQITNFKNGSKAIYDWLKTTVAKGGDLISKNASIAAAELTKAAFEGPPVNPGYTLPLTTIPFATFRG
jgi:hypothetical protein